MIDIFFFLQQLSLLPLFADINFDIVFFLLELQETVETTKYYLIHKVMMWSIIIMILWKC
jgi:hypothetical protein